MVCLPQRTPALNARDVHVWRIALGGDPIRHIASLSPIELVRLERHRGERRARFAISHGAAREVLAGYLGCDPAKVPLDCGYGRPPAVPGLELSLSHTDGLALLAVGRAPVGVDVEASSDAEDDDLQQLADATLAPAELRAFERAAPENRASFWLRSWVRKEAALKATGDGLGDRAPCELDVSGARIGELELLDLDMGPDHLAALAGTPPIMRVRVQEWVDESS
jgi:4'-phosphopantetheinyl transferase